MNNNVLLIEAVAIVFIGFIGVLRKKNPLMALINSSGIFFGLLAVIINQTPGALVNLKSDLFIWVLVLWVAFNTLLGMAFVYRSRINAKRNLA